ncbi:hypothetical protein NE236_41630 [Actinoallomurus purpureus]|uniref:hypothetical protein n=1 Tax=Actinoallomurus purpureus TaxID=478114 RepID=UPI0020936D6F|nr:hypothetical protein [Actinoallomurus purpureus]MCO6011471.1 hypothetical protein [Actinoallomurus purpureus]
MNAKLATFIRALGRVEEPRTEISIPEPTTIGTGPYRLFDDSVLTSITARRLKSLTAAMASAGHEDPTHWFTLPWHPDEIFLSLNHYYDPGRGKVRWKIEGPGVAAELEDLLEQKRAADEQAKRAEAQRQAENWEKWRKEDAKREAQRAAEEAAKPRLVISYLTRVGEALGDAHLAVEVVTRPGYRDRTDHTETVATCKTCGESHTVEWNGAGWDHQRWMNDQFDTDGKLSTPRAQKWAREHAGECRAMPPNS